MGSVLRLLRRTLVTEMIGQNESCDAPGLSYYTTRCAQIKKQQAVTTHRRIHTNTYEYENKENCHQMSACRREGYGENEKKENIRKKSQKQAYYNVIQ